MLARDISNNKPSLRTHRGNKEAFHSFTRLHYTLSNHCLSQRTCILLCYTPICMCVYTLPWTSFFFFGISRLFFSPSLVHIKSAFFLNNSVYKKLRIKLKIGEWLGEEIIVFAGRLKFPKTRRANFLGGGIKGKNFPTHLLPPPPSSLSKSQEIKRSSRSDQTSCCSTAAGKHLRPTTGRDPTLQPLRS